MSDKFHPTKAKNRIELLDVLRGVAISGVLIVNLLYFSGYIYTPFVDLANMSLPKVNYTLIMIVFNVFMGKFYPVLGILFGAGIFMQFKKSDRPGFLVFFVKRMLLLLLIGALHQLIWPGDVILIYALYSFLLIPFRNQKANIYLLFAAILFILNFAAIYIIDILGPTSPQVEQTAWLHLPDISPNELLDKVSNGGISGFIFLVKNHFEVLWTFERYASLSFRILLIFLTGGYLYGSGFLTEKAHKLKYFFIFLSIGLLGTFLCHYVSWSFKIIDNLFLALAYISLIAYFMKKPSGKKALMTLSPLGRMTLTNYIMQSIVNIILFYGIGFGLYGKLPLYQVLLIGILFLIIQIKFSSFWLKKYNFGPVEWFWRRLSYGSTLKNKRQ